MYRDYAESPGVFHWESQNAPAVASEIGQRYLTHRQLGTHVVLFARETKAADIGGPRPYLCLGPADYVRIAASAPSPSPGAYATTCPPISSAPPQWSPDDRTKRALTQ